jgi:hypothetical protein
VIGGEGDLNMILVLSVRRKGGEVAGNGFASSGEQVVKFGSDEALPIAVGFGVSSGGVRKEAVTDAGSVALGEDVRQTLETIEEDGIKAAEAEAGGPVGLEVEIFHSVFSMWARSW